MAASLCAKRMFAASDRSASKGKPEFFGAAHRKEAARHGPGAWTGDVRSWILAIAAGLAVALLVPLSEFFSR